jgi:hypothetical protein
MTRLFPFRGLKWGAQGDSARMEKTSRDSAAVRALAEAEQRRAGEIKTERPKEINGHKGPEPTRFGDWENRGIASDF